METIPALAWVFFIVGLTALIISIIYGIRTDRRAQSSKVAQEIEEAGVAESNGVKDQNIYLDSDAIAKIIANLGADSGTVTRCRQKMFFYNMGIPVKLKDYFEHVQVLVGYTEYVMCFKNLEGLRPDVIRNGTVITYQVYRNDFAIEEYNDARCIRDAIRIYAKENNLNMN